ncbi:tetratricopeptide repeat-containing sensor histidine kinase [bacterium SCSIO 12741]|nr:tetratricopeptide repeat-containing sensor histidine kinase [bacterium SCSIO 12741]
MTYRKGLMATLVLFLVVLLISPEVKAGNDLPFMPHGQRELDDLYSHQADSNLSDSSRVSAESDSLFNARFYNLLGKIHAEKGNYAIALEYFNTTNEYFNPDSPSSLFVTNLLDRGNVFYLNKDFGKAQSDFEQARNLSMQLNDSMALSTAMNNLALIALNQNNLKEAESLFMQSYQIRLGIDDPFLVGHSLGYLGYYHFFQEDYEQSLNLYKQAVNSIEKVDKEDHDDQYFQEWARLCNDQGLTFYKMNQAEMANKCAEKAKSIAEKIANNQSRIKILYQAAKLQFISGFHKPSLDLSKETLEMARNTGDREMQLQINQLISNNYEKLRDFEKAIDFARKSNELKQQISEERIAQRLADERFSYQVLTNRRLLKMARQESDLKTTELQAQQRISQLLIVIILISLIAVISLYVSNKQKIKVNQKLVETNQLIEKQNQEIRKQQTEISLANEQLQNKFKELEDMASEKSHLLSIVAHDLRTPLNSIIGLCDLLKLEEENGKFSEDTPRYIQLIKESGNRMLNMITTLLNVRKIENQNIEVKLTDVAIRKVVDKILEEHLNWYERKSIHIDASQVDAEVSIRVDQYLFHQVAENLITNAIKYSSFNTDISLFTRVKNDRVLLAVMDHGPGISDEDKTKLFTRYQRLSARPTAGEDSIGIGLSLVKKLTDLMDGNVWCDTELGKGTTFYVEFPKTV